MNQYNTPSSSRHWRNWKSQNCGFICGRLLHPRAEDTEPLLTDAQLLENIHIKVKYCDFLKIWAAFLFRANEEMRIIRSSSMAKMFWIMNYRKWTMTLTGVQMPINVCKNKRKYSKKKLQFCKFLYHMFYLENFLYKYSSLELFLYFLVSCCQTFGFGRDSKVK